MLPRRAVGRQVAGEQVQVADEGLDGVDRVALILQVKAPGLDGRRQQGLRGNGEVVHFVR